MGAARGSFQRVGVRCCDSDQLACAPTRDRLLGGIRPVRGLVPGTTIHGEAAVWLVPNDFGWDRVVACPETWGRACTWFPITASVRPLRGSTE